MKNYKMVLAYDGTRYNGWQKQGNTENTIQEKLERILQEISGAETEVFGSGRTDAGTHATGQVMNFHINWNGTAEQLLDAFNAKLPEDIAALSVAEMPPRFHSRLSAKAKHYSYSIWIGKHSPVLSENIPSVVRKRLMFRQCGRRRQPSLARMISKASAPIKE